MVESQIIPAGTKTLDEHVSVIIECKERVKLAIFDYVDAIQSAHKDLEHNVFQSDLSKRLNMSPSTLSRWLKISQSTLIASNKDSVPPVFSSLYELTILESIYHQEYGDVDGTKKLQTLFNRNSITERSEHSDIKHFLQDIKSRRLMTKKGKKQTRIISLRGGSGYDTPSNPTTLSELIDTNSLFRTIVIIPPSELLSKWGDDGMFYDDVYNDFPISDLRGMSLDTPINCFVIVKSSRIDVAIKLLISSGFSYRNVYLPNQPLPFHSKNNDDEVIVFGQRGRSKSPSNIQISSTSPLLSSIELGEQLGSGPNILLFESVEREGWTCLTDPI